MTTRTISRWQTALLLHVGLATVLASLSVPALAESPIVDDDYVLKSDSLVVKRIVELGGPYKQWLEEGLVDICLYEDATTYFVEFNAKHIERKPSDPPDKPFLILEIFNSLLMDKKTLEAKDWMFETEMRELPRVFIGATGSLPQCSIFLPLSRNYRIVPDSKRPPADSQAVVPDQTPKK